MAAERVRGERLRGDTPQRLQLSDGSRLMLDGQEGRGQVGWRRLGDRRGPAPAHDVSVDEAVRLAGDEFSGYVATRTRAEAEWMRAMADWYRDQADRLCDQLVTARS